MQFTVISSTRVCLHSTQIDQLTKASSVGCSKNRNVLVAAQTHGSRYSLMCSALACLSAFIYRLLPDVLSPVISKLCVGQPDLTYMTH